jgi:Lipocalin-like domain
MKTLPAICVVALFAFAAVATSGQAGGADAGVRDRFVGGWRLVSLERQAADGTLNRIDCCGLFVFTHDGHASVQVMRRTAEGQAQAASDPYSQGGYEATYGRYEIDESTHTFTFHVEGSLMRALIGRDLPRVYEFSGKRLIVKPPNPDEHWKATWERY